MNRFYTLPLCVALATCVLPNCAVAQSTPALSYTGGNPTNTGRANFTVGWEFDVISSITVDALDDSSATPGTQVRLFNASGLIASATPTSRDPLVGTPGFYVQSITPVVLDPGTYFIAEDIGEYSSFTTQAFGIATNPDITYVNLVDELGQGQDPDAPLYLGTSFGPGMFGPDFNIETQHPSTPEPGSTALALSCLVACTGAVVRRRSKAASVSGLPEPVAEPASSAHLNVTSR